MSQDDKIFKDPGEFKPDRWNKDAEKKLHPFSNLPFGFGPRSCYGMFRTDILVMCSYFDANTQYGCLALTLDKNLLLFRHSFSWCPL